LDCPPDAQDVPSEADAGADVPGLGASYKSVASADKSHDAASERLWV
jgi:hypothetical protein